MEETSTIEYTPEQVTEAIDKSFEPEVDTTDEPPKTPEVKEEPQETKESDATPSDEDKEPENKVNCPQKFLSQDGTPDLNKILEAYTNLESSFTQKTQEYNSKLEQLTQAKEQEQESIAQKSGFDSYEEQQIAIAIADRASQNYRQYLDYLDPEQQFQVAQQLEEYSRTGKQSLLKQIEDNFGTDIVKAVSNDATLFENELRAAVAQQKQAEYTERLNQEARNYVQNAVDTYPDWFKIKPFYDFFGDALRTKGDTFEVGAFVKHIENLREYFRNELIQEQNSKKENDSDKKALIQQTPSGAKASNSTFDMNNCSDAELSLEISKYI